MIVVKSSCGLGNQLFEYAMYREIKKRNNNEEVYVDIGWHEKPEGKLAWYPYLVDNLSLKVDKIERDKYIVKEYYVKNHGLTEAEFNKIRRETCLPILNLVEETRYYACENLWEKHNAYIVGGFQNIDNFKTVLKDIKQEVVFPENSNIYFMEIKKNIEESNSVALHIRMNDFDRIEDFEKVCPVSYYEKALEYIEKKEKNIKVFVFSNNLEKVKERLSKHREYIWVNINDRMNGIYDMQLISLCKHIIFGNSTFGWWSAAFNKNEQAIIISPKKWNEKLKGIQNEDINLCLDNWIAL